MLLTDEQYVIKWLSQYGPLPKAQWCGCCGTNPQPPRNGC